jgi:hypothetical protein
LPAAFSLLPGLVAVLIILWVAFVFCRPILHFNDELVPQSTEFEPNVGLISPAYSSLREHGEFPFWNPYADTGVPYLGDPAGYLLNPLGSAPALILGPINGSKVGILLAIAFTGFSAYYLAAVLGLSWPARVWAGVLLALNGHLLARIFVGQFQLAIAFPFIAFSLAFFIQSLRREHRAYPLLAGASVALLLFSGFLYYFLFIIPGLVIVFLFFAVESQAAGFRIDKLKRLAVRGAAGTAWAVGFSAVLLIPFWLGHDFVSKPNDPFLRNSQTMTNSFRNFLMSDRAYYQTPHRGLAAGFLGEYYSYIGFVPLLALPFVIAAFWRGNRLLIGLMATLFVFYLAWSSAKHTPFHYAYQTFPSLYNFRWTSRALAAATPPLIMLGAVGIDELLRFATTSRLLMLRRRVWFGRVSWPTVPLGLVLALGLIVFLARDARDDVFHVNRGLLALVPRRADHLVVGDWFKANVPDAAYVEMPDGSPGVSLRLAEDGILRLAPVYWRPRLDYQVKGNPPPAEQIIHPRAKYLVLTNDAPPQQPDAHLVASFPARYIYELENSPPFASVVKSADPPLGTTIPWGDKAREARARIVSPNRIEVEATSSVEEEDRVLVLQSYVPGWRVEVDGERAGAVNNMSGFLSVEARPGQHTYLLVFDPRAQRYGLAISLGTLLAALLFLSPLHGLVGRLGRRAAVPAHDA